MYLCYVTGTLKDVVRGEKIEWNPDTQGITFTTDSTVGSRDAVWVSFSNNAGNWAGNVRIYFNTQMQYLIGWCSLYVNFPVSLPAAPDKTWTIEYNTAEQRVVYYCNGVQALNVLLSDSECTEDSDWRTTWERKPTQIQFDSTSDSASDSYCFSSNTGKYNERFQEA